VFKWCHQGQCAVEEKTTCRMEVLNLNSGIGEISIWVSNFYPASQPAIRRRALHVRATKRRGLVMELPPMLWFSAHGVAQNSCNRTQVKEMVFGFRAEGEGSPKRERPLKCSKPSQS
jgi:hypothetical protein